MPQTSSNNDPLSRRYCVESEAATEEIGRQIAEQLHPGDTVCLTGTLGAGKTHLAKAIMAALGANRNQVVSPTFTLCNEYAGGSCPLYHLDLYRVADEDELLELGFDEYCDGNGITLVEWADRFPNSLPDERIEIEITVTGPTQRTLTLTRHTT